METEKEQSEEFKRSYMTSTLSSSDEDEGRARKRAKKRMEKFIYVHISSLVEEPLLEDEGGGVEEPLLEDEGGGVEEPLLEDEGGGYSCIYHSENDWHLIKQVEGSGGVKLTPTFERAIKSGPSGSTLLHSRCLAIGSCIYVIDGRYRLHFIDTHNLKDGWTTICTIPFTEQCFLSTSIYGRWLYVLGHEDEKKYFQGFAINVDSQEVSQLNLPADLGGVPFFSTCLSPEKIVVGMYSAGKCPLYEIDCKNNTWTAYLDSLPYDAKSLIFRTTFVLADGILYIYDWVRQKFISYDIREKSKLYEVGIPSSIMFDGRSVLHLIVLSKDRFCIVWRCPNGFNRLLLGFSRFSVSFRAGVPTIDLEDAESFHVDGHDILNVLAVDPISDEARSSSINCP